MHVPTLPARASDTSGTSSRTRSEAQAHSLAARANYEQCIADPEERGLIHLEGRLIQRPQTVRLGFDQPPLISLELAAHHANESIKLGVVSPASLVVGCKMREVAETLGVDVTQLRGARRLRALWAVVEQRVEELYAAKRASQRKIGRRPEAYACALEGCGVRSEQRAGLRSCKGNCPPDLKPRYCSKECQAKVSILITPRRSYVGLEYSNDISD